MESVCVMLSSSVVIQIHHDFCTHHWAKQANLKYFVWNVRLISGFWEALRVLLSFVTVRLAMYGVQVIPPWTHRLVLTGRSSHAGLALLNNVHWRERNELMRVIGSTFFWVKLIVNSAVWVMLDVSGSGTNTQACVTTCGDNNWCLTGSNILRWTQASCLWRVIACVADDDWTTLMVHICKYVCASCD